MTVKRPADVTHHLYKPNPHTLQGQAQMMANGPKASPRKSRWLLGAAAVMGIAAITASAQVVSSPFAAKGKQQAWETPSQPAAPAAQQPRAYYPSSHASTSRYSPPQPSAPTVPAAHPNTAASSIATAPQTAAQFGSSYKAPRAEGLSFQAPAPTDGTHYPGRPRAVNAGSAGHAGSADHTQYGQYQPSSTPPLNTWPLNAAPLKMAPLNNGQWQAPAQQAPAWQTPAQSGQYRPRAQGQAVQNQAFQNQGYQSQGHQNQGYQNQGYRGQNYNAPPTRPVMAKAGWKERLGLSNLATTISGFLKLGAGATDADTARDDGWREDFIGDGMVRGEVSAITLGGLEYGVGAELRGQYDPYRRGFGGLVGNCPPTQLGCSGRIVSGVPVAIRGHTSQFYTAGLDNREDITAQLEGAYIFLRSAYGDLTVGRDDGAAYLFSLGAPSLVAVNASNSPVDYTGLDSVKTVNDASGFAEKITYVSPRLLGDQIGVGVQIGASYAPDAKACGVDYCVKNNGDNGSNTLAPDLEDIIEFGLSLDRTFQNGLSVEGTTTYARGSERSGFAEMDDLQAFGAGLEFALKGWRLGGSYLQSNNALQDGDYTAYDVGLTYKPARWGASLSYGHATDDNIDLTSDQATLGFVYDLTDKITLGTGVQYARRKVPTVVSVNGADVLARGRESATSVFVEGGITF